MTGSEIFNRLKISDRWGANNQPSIYWVVAVLEQLPVRELSVSTDRLQISLERDLKPLEYWAIRSLSADEFNEDRESKLIDLWWD